MKIPVSAWIVTAWFATNAVAQDTEWAGKINLARQAQASGRYRDAIALLRQAVALADGFGRKDARTWETYGSLAIVYEDAGFPGGSMRFNRQTIGMVKAAIGKDNATYAHLLANLATVYVGLGDMAPAERQLREALRIETGLPHPDPDDIATLQSRLAVVLANRHRYAETERLIGLALPVLERTGDTVETATALGTLGIVRGWQRHYDESLELVGEAVRMMEKQYGPGNPLLLRSMSTLAAAYTLAGRKEEAGAAFRRAITICEESLPPGHPSRAALLANYARYLRGAGQGAQAKAVEAEARSLALDMASRDGAGMTVDVSDFRQK
jgi:tetratricopeptide (TPR) repeat protein